MYIYIYIYIPKYLYIRAKIYYKLFVWIQLCKLLIMTCDRPIAHTGYFRYFPLTQAQETTRFYRIHLSSSSGINGSGRTYPAGLEDSFLFPLPTEKVDMCTFGNVVLFWPETMDSVNNVMHLCWFIESNYFCECLFGRQKTLNIMFVFSTERMHKLNNLNVKFQWVSY